MERPSAQLTIESLPGALRAVVPARRNVLVRLFLCVWLGGWLYGMAAFAKYLLAPSPSPIDGGGVAWLVAFTLGGAFALFALAWQVAGREVVTLDSATLELRVEVAGRGWSRAYRKDEVRNLRSVRFPPKSSPRESPGFPPIPPSGTGPVAFDYRGRTIRFGTSLDEAEARHLVRELAPYLQRGTVDA